MNIDFSKIDDAIEARRSAMIKCALEKVREGNGAQVFGAYCATVLCLPDELLDEDDLRKANEAAILASNYLNNCPRDTRGGRGEPDFASIRLVRALFAPESHIAPETQKAFKRFFLNDRYDSCHYSENHLLMSRASRYLAACHYEGEYFNQYLISAEEARRIDHDYIVSYLQHRAKRGWAEFNSMAYEIHNFNTLMSLYDCSPDEDIKKLAGMTMDVMLLTMLENTTENGIYGGAHGRAYGYIVTGLNHGIYELNQYYFGLGDFENKNVLPNFSEPSILLSDWRPDRSVYEVFADKKYPFAAREKAQNHTLAYRPLDFGFVNKYTYNTSVYSIGCVNHQDPFPKHPLDWYQGHQQTNFTLAFASHPKAGITVHHPGETPLHAYWYGDQNCNCNHLFGDKNTVIGIFYIPKKHHQHMEYIHANVPKTYYDSVVEDEENNRLFIKIGDAYAALTFSHPYKWGGKDPESEIVIYDGEKQSDIRIAFACQAGDKENDGGFEAFISSVKKKAFEFNQEKLTLSFGNMLLEVIEDSDNANSPLSENKYIDGALIDTNYKYTYDSPFMKSVSDSGIIKVYFGDMVRTMDFIGITDTTVKK